MKRLLTRALELLGRVGQLLRIEQLIEFGLAKKAEA